MLSQCFFSFWNIYFTVRILKLSLISFSLVWFKMTNDCSINRIPSCRRRYVNNCGHRSLIPIPPTLVFGNSCVRKVDLRNRVYNSLDYQNKLKGAFTEANRLWVGDELERGTFSYMTTGFPAPLYLFLSTKRSNTLHYDLFSTLFTTTNPFRVIVHHQELQGNCCLCFRNSLHSCPGVWVICFNNHSCESSHDSSKCSPFWSVFHYKDDRKSGLEKWICGIGLDPKSSFVQPLLFQSVLRR